MTVYGDISRNTAGYFSAELLKRGQPLIVLEKSGQMKSLPSNETKTMNWRRYEALDDNPDNLVLLEGVTPTAQKPTYSDVSVTLSQYGGLLELTDVIADTHIDPVLKEYGVLTGEQTARFVERLRFGVLKACTNKFYANGTARTDVNTAVSLNLQRKIVRALQRQLAMELTQIVKSTPSFNTEAILPAYLCYGHIDLENDIRGISGFIDVKDYGNTKPLEGEIGSVGRCRYILTTLFAPYADGGGNKGTMVSTSGTKADVYPILYIGRDAWAGVALKGKFAIAPTVINPSQPSKSDPLGQRGYVGWKTMQNAVILNDLWMAVAEVGATELS